MMRSIDGLLGDGNLRDVYFGLVGISRTGWVNRGIPGVFVEDDFAHSLVVEKGAVCVAARYGFDMDVASVMGFVHDWPEFRYGNKIPGEVDLVEKKKSESGVMRDICGRSGNLSGLFSLWEDFDSQLSVMGRNCFYVDKVANSPVAVVYRNNMGSIVEYYRGDESEFERLLGLDRYEGISKGDVFDVMEASFEEFHSYAKRKVDGESVFVDAVDEVMALKTRDVGEIFETFYRGLAGDSWSEVCGRYFYVDKMARGKVGLERLRVCGSEVLGLVSE